MKRAALAVAATLLAAACQDTSGPRTPSPELRPESQPSFAAAPTAEVIPGQYIVVLRGTVDDVPGVARELVARHGGSLRFTYQTALKGFSASISAEAAAAIRGDPRVAYVEQNQVVRIITEQTGATWGIDRIDQRDLPLSTTYVYNATGKGVKSYIIDTGIRTTHSDFGGRAVHGTDKVDNDNDASDCNGHGTHVAGTVGGTTWGVAKEVTLVAVRVLDCGGSGTWEGVIAGVDWVTADHQAGQPATANMSLGGGFSQAVNDAVTNSVNDGVTYAVAAGNGYSNACDGSPASTAAAMTIGATDINDNEAAFSDRGNCLDMWAPGVNITSAWSTGDNATNTISGTSMATPHVAGGAALYLESNPTATPAQVDQALSDNATTGKIKWTDFFGAKPPPPPAGQDYLLYTPWIVAGPPPVPTPPSAPSNASAKPASSSSVTVTWTDNAGNEDGFKVQRSSSSTGPWTTIATTGPNVTSYTDGDRASETEVCYQVIAFNAIGDSGPSNVSCTTPPAAPSNLSAAKGSPAHAQIKLTWTDNSSVEDGQQIQRCTGAGCTNFSTIATVGANVTSYDDNSVVGNTTYTYRARATKDGGVSSFSNTASATTDPDPNAAPVARYTWTCTNTKCDFDATTSSDDGSITSYSWTFGDGTTGSGATPFKQYAAKGTYTVTLTVTDNGSPQKSDTATCQVQALNGKNSGSCQ